MVISQTSDVIGLHSNPRGIAAVLAKQFHHALVGVTFTALVPPHAYKTPNLGSSPYDPPIILSSI